SLLPGAGAPAPVGRVDRVELRARRRIDAALAGRAVARQLDRGQIRLERDALVVQPVRERAREPERLGMELPVASWIRERPRPVTQVRRAVEVELALEAAADLDQQRRARVEAERVVAVLLRIVDAGGHARALDVR